MQENGFIKISPEETSLYEGWFCQFSQSTRCLRRCGGEGAGWSEKEEVLGPEGSEGGKWEEVIRIQDMRK